MEIIKFENLQNWKSILLLVTSMILILTGALEPIEIENSKIYKWIMALGFLIQVIYFSRSLWYKNYVQWNKVGFTIKIDSFRSQSLKFEDLKSIKLVDDKLDIDLLEQKENIIIDLSKIKHTDREKLHQILQNNFHSHKKAII